MRSAFVVWLALSAYFGYVDSVRSAWEGDDRPWWAIAILAMLGGAVYASVPGALMVAAGLP